MSESRYVHGFSSEEQRRLIEQAEYFRDMLIPLGLSYRPGETVLEMGCAAGASLAEIAETYAVRVAGIDLEPAQIAFAREHLAEMGVKDPDLRVGDATALPWDDDSFDHVYIMWLLEHLPDSRAVLGEAMRVLKPGGTITLTETDYDTFTASPTSEPYEYLRTSIRDLFAASGQPTVGRELGAQLRAAGFVEVTSRIAGFHFFNDGTDALQRHVEYIASWAAPMIDRIVETLGRDRNKLDAGIDHLLGLAEREDGSYTQLVYRASAAKTTR